MLAKKIQHEKAAVGLIEQARREWVAAEAEVKEFHAKHIQPLMEERLRLQHQLALAEAAVKEAASLEELAAAKERVAQIEAGLEELRQKAADVDQISAKKQEAALAAKQRHELLLGRKAWLENAVRQQERTVRARQQAVEEAERALLAARDGLAEAFRVLEKLEEELAAM